MFSAFFEAPNGAPSLSTGTILIESDAGNAPTFNINLRGEACQRDADRDLCGRCGDGIIDDDEACDDGNLNERDDCLNDCTEPRCGDGIVNGEEADDGNDSDADACLTNCVEAACGDGIVHGCRGMR